MHNERFNYKLVDDVSDLTNLQILYIIACAELYKDAMEAASKPAPNPLEITSNDSPEEMMHKLKLIGDIHG